MIQRIQTVYLFFGVLVLAGFGFTEAPWNGLAAARYAWFVPSLVGLLIAAGATGLGSIFLYRQRETQRRVVIGAQVLTVCVAAVLYGGMYATGTLSFTDRSGIEWGKSIALFLPILAYGLFLLARRGIERDIHRVRSMDRIR